MTEKGQDGPEPAAWLAMYEGRTYAFTDKEDAYSQGFTDEDLAPLFTMEQVKEERDAAYDEGKNQVSDND